MIDEAIHTLRGSNSAPRLRITIRAGPLRSVRRATPPFIAKMGYTWSAKLISGRNAKFLIVSANELHLQPIYNQFLLEIYANQPILKMLFLIEANIHIFLILDWMIKKKLYNEWTFLTISRGSRICDCRKKSAKSIAYFRNKYIQFKAVNYVLFV